MDAFLTKMSKSCEHDCKNAHEGNNKDDFRIARFFTRIGILVVLFIATFITLNFCYSVYFDRYKVYRDSVECTVDILSENRAQYWLRNGTLLGATRIGKLILWDSGLNFGITRNSNNTDIFRSLHQACFPRTFYTDGNEFATWHMCNNKICAVFDEASFSNGVVRTASGVSMETELLPLKKCTLMDVSVFCPQNETYYLQSGFGSNWLTTPFMDLFGGNATH